MLREHLKCQLPVEVFSFPSEKPDPDTREAMEKLNVKFLIVEWAEKDIHRNKNFVESKQTLSDINTTIFVDNISRLILSLTFSGLPVSAHKSFRACLVLFPGTFVSR
jgi:hypothetical protein